MRWRRSNHQSPSDHCQPNCDRGQTTLDYAIGISIFLAVLIFIFLFIPGLLQPFSTGAQDNTVSANRVADQLTNSLLGSPRDPFVLDSHCTVTFFSNSTAARCDLSPAPVEEQLNTDPNRQSLNVTIQGNVTQSGVEQELLCWDTQSQSVENASDSSCNEPFARGDIPPQNNAESVKATRVVSLNGIDVILSVETW